MTTGEYSWTLEAYEDQGYLWLKWDTNSPFRAQQSQLHVYNESDFPSNPLDETKAWCWDTESPNKTWNTGLLWGIGWHCAWIAEIPPNGPYTYVVKTITDESMETTESKQLKTTNSRNTARGFSLLR